MAIKKSIAQKPQSINELEGLEAQKEASRHLQVMVDKPCVSAFFVGKAWPEVGERGIRFYALVSELKRVGLTEPAALDRILTYYRLVPAEIINGPGQDGRSFSQKELESIVKSAYKNDEIKSYGCNSGMWDSTCPGPEMCHFKKQLSKGKEQSREAAYYAFLFNWLGAKNKEGKKLLSETEIRTYLALDGIEKKRGYKPGSVLFASWKEISSISGITDRKTGPALEALFWNGLILYKKGMAQERGIASEIQRVIPIPRSP